MTDTAAVNAGDGDRLGEWRVVAGTADAVPGLADRLGDGDGDGEPDTDALGLAVAALRDRPAGRTGAS